MNKIVRFVGRISAETCLKINYFGSKLPKITKRWGLCPQTHFPHAAGGFAPKPPFR